MTATRDPDRLLRAWLDLMPDEAPDRAIAAVLQATQSARQVRVLPWDGIRRNPRMNKLILIAATALVVVALAGGAIFFAGSTNAPAVPTPTTAISLPSPEASREFAVPAAEPLWGDWMADVEAIPGIQQPAGRLQLSIDWEQGIRVWVQQDVLDQRWVVEGASYPAAANELRVRALNTIGCASNEEGRYAWDRSTDGLFLTLTLIEDQCATRATVFARTWVHSLGAVNDGGPGVASGTTPMTQVTLPRGQRLGASAGTGWQEIKTFGDAQPFQAFVVIRNPGGFGAPCSTTDTRRQSIRATTADFISYVEGLPGATLTTEATEIDGRPAIQFDYRIADSVECASGEIAALHPEDPSDPTVWTSIPGELQRMYIVQVDASTTFLLWYQGNSETERAVIDSIRFIDQLPTP